MDLSDEEKIRWMAKENMLIKRPVITTGEQIIVGYNEPEYLEKLPNPKG
jgi:arsenate reductase-like glutaredoxin family protein